ncbi:MAG: hypothetical protein NUV57_03525 [archaeon]|nr:hypothetical protein [archaeon]
MARKPITSSGKDRRGVIPATDKISERLIPDSRKRLSKLKGFDFESAYSRVYSNPNTRKITPEKFRLVCITLIATDYSTNMISRGLGVAQDTILKINKILGLRSAADVQAIKAHFQKLAYLKPGIPVVPPEPVHELPLSVWKKGLELLEKDNLEKDTGLTPELRKQLIARAKAEIGKRKQ